MTANEIQKDFMLMSELCKNPSAVFPRKSREYWLARQWLQKIYDVKSSDLEVLHLRNIYFTQLMTCLITGELHGPFLNLPPYGALEKYSFDSLNDTERNENPSENFRCGPTFEHCYYKARNQCAPKEMDDPFIVSATQAREFKRILKMPAHQTKKDKNSSKKDNKSRYNFPCIGAGSLDHLQNFSSSGIHDFCPKQAHQIILQQLEATSGSPFCHDKGQSLHFPLNSTSKTSVETANKSTIYAAQMSTHNISEFSKIFKSESSVTLTPNPSLPHRCNRDAFLDSNSANNASKLRFHEPQFVDSARESRKPKIFEETFHAFNENLTADRKKHQELSYECIDNVLKACKMALSHEKYELHLKKTGKELKIASYLLDAVRFELSGDTPAGCNDFLEQELERYKSFLMKLSKSENVFKNFNSEVRARTYLMLALQKDLIRIVIKCLDEIGAALEPK